ncbi:MAG TPA: hypothetical protein VHD35_10445 [Chitinophagaceae bacterium]|nr:hypothetical protein [Chitinophagaceae bacterium]
MRAGILITFSIFLSAGFLDAQRILYSPYIGNEYAPRFEVIGKSAEYYWLQTGKPQFCNRKSKGSFLDDKNLRFEIFDTRMNPVRTVPYFLPGDLIKEYLITGDEYFDQLIFRPVDQKITVSLNRFTADGSRVDTGRILAEFPATMKCEDFLLIRSQDKTKILLLGFETITDSAPELHAFLFDKNWNLVHQKDYSDPNISKPFLQYDLVEYPLEDYNSVPVKLSDNGNWLMMVSSATSNNYVLFYFKGAEDPDCREIKLAAAAEVNDVGLYFDNAKQEGFAGLLSGVRRSAIKNVRIAHYTLENFHVDFDTSYYFNSLAVNKSRNENMFEEYFLTVPGKGFMFLKEYGRQLPADAYKNEWNENDQPGTADSSQNSFAHNDFWNKGDYTRYDNLAGTGKNFDRGDLTLYYFPSKADDSCWSGIINKEQVTELGRSYLSYVFFPRQDKLFFLYNSIYRNEYQYGSATVLDEKGNPLNEGLEYWKINNTLIFQKARRISENELAVPYVKNMRNGFAIIRL